MVILLLVRGIIKIGEDDDMEDINKISKISKVVLKETKYIGLVVLTLSILTQGIFLIIGKWDYTVLLGNILSGTAAVLNFLLMGVTIQAATESDEKQGRNKMKTSQVLRTFMLFAVAALGCVLSCFNTITVLVPLFFPRIAIALRVIKNKI